MCSREKKVCTTVEVQLFALVLLCLDPPSFSAYVHFDDFYMFRIVFLINVECAELLLCLLCTSVFACIDVFIAF